MITEKSLGDESARLRFLREARAAAGVRHPNVASVFHLGRSGESYFYAMEFVEGETLEDLIKRSGRVESKMALDIVAQVAAGLAAVHKTGLVHRDIKPSNIMVSHEEGGSPTAKIIDLGLAKPVADSHSDAAISLSGDLCWDTGFRQSRAMFGWQRGHPFGSLFTWRNALEDAHGPGAIQRFSSRSDVSTSACPRAD